MLFLVLLQQLHLRPHSLQQVGHALDARLGVVVEAQLLLLGLLQDALLEDAERSRRFRVEDALPVLVLEVDLVLGDQRLIAKLDALLDKGSVTSSREGEPKSWKMELSQAVIWKYLNSPVIFKTLALRST